jgi:hypothetical protein
MVYPDLIFRDMPKYAPVGSYVLSHYWGYVYEVLEHCENGSVLVAQIDPHPMTREYCPFIGRGRVWSHRTPLDGRDQILALPTNVDQSILHRLVAGVGSY